MDLVQNLALGFQACLQPINLFYCFIGVLIGTLVGVLPGLGPSGAIAILLPATFHAPPLAAIIMLAGVYYGGQYGGSTTSILINIPGEAASIVTCLDGHQMALKGRAGPALGICAFGSFIAGTLGVIGLMLLAQPMVRFALKFGPPEYLSLVILGLVILSYLSTKSLLKSLAMAALGLIIGFVGTDIVGGQERFTLGIDELLDGIRLVPMVVGLFGFSEILQSLEELAVGKGVIKTHIQGLLPSRKDWHDSFWPILRGTAVGFLLGVLPGGGAILSSFASYAVEKKVSKHPERFGTGTIEGVAGPESAGNAASSSGFIPLLTLGIPPSSAFAMLFAALLIHGIRPGPLLLQDHPEVFWGVVTSMYIGNAMLLALNLPLIGMWVQVLKVPPRFLLPIIALFAIIGVYSTNNSAFDLWVMIAFGVFGFIMRQFGFEPAPLILAFILGPMLEQNFRQALIISHGDLSIFVTRPISVACLVIAAGLLVAGTIRRKAPLRPNREKD